MNESETSAGLSPDQKTVVYAPGTTVRITQQIPRHTNTITTSVVGKVVRQERQPSGSWYARNPRDKVWLDRLVIEKADGEISILNLDEYSHVEVVDGLSAIAGSAPMISPAQDPTANIT